MEPRDKKSVNRTAIATEVHAHERTCEKAEAPSNMPDRSTADVKFHELISWLKEDAPLNMSKSSEAAGTTSKVEMLVLVKSTREAQYQYIDVRRTTGVEEVHRLIEGRCT